MALIHFSELLFGGIKERTMGKYCTVGMELEAFVLGIHIKAKGKQQAV